VGKRLGLRAILLFVLFVAGVCVVARGNAHIPLPAIASQRSFPFSRNALSVYPECFVDGPASCWLREHDRVRDYLVSQVCGRFGPHPGSESHWRTAPFKTKAGTVENIVARVKGSSGASDSVCAGAHYDTPSCRPARETRRGLAALLERFAFAHRRSAPP